MALIYEQRALTRFWEKVEKTPSCWLWVGGLSKGYGIFSYQRKSLRAHRVSLSLVQDLLPEKVVCHRCDVRNCVNPSHLFQGSQKDNVQDMIKKGRGAKQNWTREQRKVFSESITGAKNPNSKLYPAAVQAMREIYKDKLLSGRKIALLFGLDHSTVGSILRHETWTHC